MSETLRTLLAAFSAGDLGAAAATFAPDARFREPGRPDRVGRSAIAEHFARFAARGAAWTFAVDAVLIDGDRACVVYRYAANEGADPSPRERAGCALVRFDRTGAIAEWREYEG